MICYGHTAAAGYVHKNVQETALLMKENIMEENVKNRIYVIGHKNPDTDSICSAITYAYLKNTIDDATYVPRRAGKISSETQFVLDYFKAEAPKYVPDVKAKVRDMEIRRTEGVDNGISLKKAWTLLNESKGTTLPIVRPDQTLEGLISIGDIAKSYMSVTDNAILSKARTPYKNILETLDGTLYVGDENAYFDKGKVIVAASSPEVMESYIEKDDMVILGNRYETQLCAIEMNAGCLVICGQAVVTKTIQILAKEKNCTIIGTPYDTYTVAHLINQSMPIRHFMKSEDLVVFNDTDFADDIKDIMASKRHRDFPILNAKGQYVGTISRRNLLGIKKRRLILVDHNEISQAVDNVEDAQIIEIIDHHRLGSMETVLPVFFRNQPVGCTATIIYQMFMEKGVPIPQQIAGLLCAAILSDTLLFRSPTCTVFDSNAAMKLAQIAGINCEEFAAQMFEAGSNMKSKTVEQIFFQDYKLFEVEKTKIGVAQITSMSDNDLKIARKKLDGYLEKERAKQDLSMVFFMLTDIIRESTELLYCGEGAEFLIGEAFHAKPKNGSAQLPGIVSRKKQLIPGLLNQLQK
mgnify:FL=1